MNYRRYPGYRVVRILVGDTLPRIALRELNDAARWPEIASVNDLRSPYIVGIGAPTSERTRRPGDTLKVPSTRAYWIGSGDEDNLYGRDLILTDRRLVAENGDFALVRGRANLHQALLHRLRTQPTELLRHPKYGCHVHLVLGEKLRPLSAALGQGFVVRALRAEPRVREVVRADVSPDGDILRIASTVQPVAENDPLDLNLVYSR